MNEIKNAKITALKWDKERGLTQWIAVEGEGWGCSFGGYHLGGNACYDWLSSLMETLDMR